MLHAILATTCASFAFAGFIGPRAFPELVTHKRNGRLHFFRIGRLSGSWCIRRKPLR